MSVCIRFRAMKLCIGVARKGWPSSCYWEVTEVKIKQDGRHGSMHGALMWMGKPHAKTHATSTLKRDWRLLAVPEGAEKAAKGLLQGGASSPSRSKVTELLLEEKKAARGAAPAAGEEVEGKEQ
ncbi:hypothetical protein H632_c1205p1 [Helicosporidium sp. ATCC 50920]|nr:hypothetical protein H632_c1205p1 [Helicosporidium sp. ATCC 50920]|eukprot:KDD74585.1 hypothetical protein H632_c1205p1 [Helicosporidium sp. ATCC 50920]